MDHRMNTHDIEPMKYGGNRSDDYVTGWNDCYATTKADRQSRNCGQCVPLSTDGKSVFIDGVGEVPLDFGEQARGNADASAVSSEPVAWYTEDHLTDKSATTYDAEVAARWKVKGWPVYPLYAAPHPAEPVVCFKCGHAKHDGECVNVAPQNQQQASGWPKVNGVGRVCTDDFLEFMKEK